MAVPRRARRPPEQDAPELGDGVDGVTEVGFPDVETLRRLTASPLAQAVQQDAVVPSATIHRRLVHEHPIL